MCTLFPHSLESLEPVKSRGYILTANVSLEYEKSEDGEQKLFGSASDRPSITPWNAVGMSFWWHKKRIIEQFRFWCPTSSGVTFSMYVLFVLSYRLVPFKPVDLPRSCFFSWLTATGECWLLLQQCRAEGETGWVPNSKNSVCFCCAVPNAKKLTWRCKSFPFPFCLEQEIARVNMSRPLSG